MLIPFLLVGNFFESRHSCWLGAPDRPADLVLNKGYWPPRHSPFALSDCQTVRTQLI